MNNQSVLKGLKYFWGAGIATSGIFGSVSEVKDLYERKKEYGKNTTYLDVAGASSLGLMVGVTTGLLFPVTATSYIIAKYF